MGEQPAARLSLPTQDIEVWGNYSKFSVIIQEEISTVLRTNDKVPSGSFLWVWPVLLAMVAVGVVGNLIVILAVGCVRKFQRPGNYLVANLSLVSLLIMASLISATILTERPVMQYGPWVCRVFPGLHSFMVPAEGFTIMYISLERTKAVREPLQKESRQSAWRKIALIWTASMALEFPRGFLFYSHDESKEGFYKCQNTKQVFGSSCPYVGYILTVFSLAFLLPSLVMLRDFVRLARHLKFLLSCPQAWSVHNGYLAYRRRLIRNALIFTASFVLVKVPTGVYFVFFRLPEHLLHHETVMFVKEWRSFFFQIAMIYIFFYPLIIFVLSTEMRKYLCRTQRKPLGSAHNVLIEKI